MGVCGIDPEKGHRQYSVRYALNDKEGVVSLLRDMHRLRERRFHAGDYAASDILADLQTAINKANITDRQRECLYYVFEMDLTQKDAGEAIGIGQDVVSGHVADACVAIAKIYADWDYGDVEVNYETSGDEERLDEI